MRTKRSSLIALVFCLFFLHNITEGQQLIYDAKPNPQKKYRGDSKHKGFELVPAGHTKIDKELLRFGKILELNISQFKNDYSYEIDSLSAKTLALKKAEYYWGGNPNIISCIPICNALGELIAYDIDMTLDGSLINEYDIIAEEWREFLLKQDSCLAIKKISDKISTKDEIYQIENNFVSFTISSNFDAYAIRGSRNGVSNFYASGWVVKSIAASILNDQNPILEEIYFLGVWERAYRFKSGNIDIVIEGQEPWSWYKYNVFNDIMKKNALLRKNMVYDLIRDSGQNPDDYLRNIRMSNKTDYENLWEENTILANHYVLGYSSHLEPFEWHYGCSPTAGAMILNYWENRSWYGKLNYWFFRAWDNVEGGTDCHIARLQTRMSDWMYTNNQGGTDADDIYPGMQGYANASGYNFSGGPNWSGYVLNWHWTDIVNEIDNNYPFVFSASAYPLPWGGTDGHSVAAVGYDDVAEDLWVYTTWSTNGNLVQRVHHAFGILDFTWGAAPHPGGAVYYDVKLESPDGYQTWADCGYNTTYYGGDNLQIGWNNFSAPGDHVNIFYSTDGGIDWTGIVNTADDGSYNWEIPCDLNSNQCRILIQQFSSSSTLASSDGSYGDFRILPGSPPNAPSNVNASDGDCNEVYITWNSVSGADGYRVYRDAVQVCDVTGTNCTDAGGSPYTTYYYIVIAYNACGDSPYSNSNSGFYIVTPDQVQNVLATDGNCDEVTITWSNLSGEDGYRIYRNGDLCRQVGAYVTSTTCDEGYPWTTYNYTVAAYNECGEGLESNPNSGYYEDDPDAPSNFQASDRQYCNYVHITWNDVQHETSYRIYRDDSPIGEELPANTISYDDYPADCNIHNYYVRAGNNCGYGSSSNINDGSAKCVPGKVTGVDASDDDCDMVYIDWDNIAYEDGYRVYRNGNQIGTTGENDIDYEDYNANPGVTYPYTVIAYNNCGDGQVSDPDNGTRLPVPDQVQNVDATDDHIGETVITWNDLNWEEGYKIYRDSDFIGTVGVNVVTYTDYHDAGCYDYTVSAYNTCGDGVMSLANEGCIINDITIWYVDDDNTTGPWEGTLEYPFQYIQEGIDSASDGDTVLAFDGRYYERINFYGKSVLVASEYLLDDDPLHIDNTIIDADTLVIGHADTGSVVCFVNGEDASSILQGFTIRGGTGTPSEAGGPSGGGIFCAGDYGNRPEIKNCKITDNSASYGGGIFCFQSALKLSDCDIINNSAANGGGFGASGAWGINLVNTTVANNFASNGNGGWGLFFGISIDSSRFEDGQHILDSYSIPSGSTVGLNNSTVYNCDILLYWDGIITATNTDFSGSHLACGYEMNLTDDSLYNSNIYIGDLDWGTIMRCKFINSSIEIHEGWVDVDSSLIDNGSITFTADNGVRLRAYNSTITGEGIITQYNSAQIILENVIIVTNNCPIIAGVNPYAYVTIDITCCDFFGFGDEWLDGTPYSLDTSNVYFLDPRFCDPDNGDYHLAENSPCAPENNSCGVLIGALPVACDPIFRSWYVDDDNTTGPWEGTLEYPFQYIQEGIDSASDGDTVLAFDGRYYERINFYETGVLVASEYLLDDDPLHIENTIIDADTLVIGHADTGSVVCFVNGEDASSILQGFTIRGGTGTPSEAGGPSGGGIFCGANSSKPEIKNCKITDNSASYGGGVFCIYFSSLQLTDCDLINNIASNGGGLGAQWGGSVRLENSLVSNNSSGGWGYEGYSIILENSRFEDGQHISAPSISYEGGSVLLNNSTMINSDIDIFLHGSITSTNSSFSGSYIGGGVGVNLTDDSLHNSYVHVWELYTATIMSCKFINSNIGVGNDGSAVINSSLINGSISLSGTNCAQLTANNSTIIGEGINVNYGCGWISLENAIVVTNGQPIISGYYWHIDITCCDFYGFEDGWFDGSFYNTPDTSNVYFLDPEFCGSLNENPYTIASTSVCAPENNDCGVLMGAYGVGCETFPIPTLSEWGMIVLALLMLAIGTIAVIRRRRVVTIEGRQ